MELGGHTLDTAVTGQDLIPGDPEKISNVIGGLAPIVVGTNSAKVGLAHIAIGEEHWQGVAADAMRNAYGEQPQKWEVISDALGQVRTALSDYRDALNTGQLHAILAIGLYRRGAELTAWSQTRYDQISHLYTTAAEFGLTSRLPQQSPYFDFGAAKRAEAQSMLDTARATVTAATVKAIGELCQARDALPAEPGLWARMVDGVVDTATTAGQQVVDFAKGAVNAVKTPFEALRALNPLDPYNLTHQQDYVANVDTIGHGLANAVEHPVDTLNQMGASIRNTAEHSPGELFGNLLAGAGIGWATGGLGETAEAAATAGMAGASKAAEDLATELSEFPKLSGTLEPPPAAPTPPWSINRTTEWGAFPGDPGASPPATPGWTEWATTKGGGWNVGFGPGANADVEAAAAFDAAGQGLNQVDQDLAGIHVRPEEPAPPEPTPGHYPPGRHRRESVRPSWRDFQDSRPSDQVTPWPQAAGHSEAPPPPAPDLAYTRRWPMTKLDQQTVAGIRRQWPEASKLSDTQILALNRIYGTSEGARINDAILRGTPDDLADLNPLLDNARTGLEALPDYHGQVVQTLHVPPNQMDRFLTGYQEGHTVYDPRLMIADKNPGPGGNVEIYYDNMPAKDLSGLVQSVTGPQPVGILPDLRRVTLRVYNHQTQVWEIHVTSY